MEKFMFKYKKNFDLPLGVTLSVLNLKVDFHYFAQS